MNRFGTALLLVCVAVLGFIARSQSVALREQQRKVRELNAKLESNSTPAVSLELQEKCARQAREEFKHEGLEGKQTANFSNHYNPKLGKCFVEVEYTDFKTPGGIFVSRTVVDAFEGKVYASYMWNNNTKKKYWEVPPLKCSVTLLSGEEKLCNSEDGPEGFNAQVKQYME
jgi:hypothetical protein